MAKKPVKKNRLVALLFGVGAVLVVVLVGLILSSVGIFDGSKEVRMFSVKDECSLVMGNLIHQIRDAGDCQIKCVNECEIRGIDFEHVDFVSKNVSCHICDCYCI